MYYKKLLFNTTFEKKNFFTVFVVSFCREIQFFRYFMIEKGKLEPCTLHLTSQPVTHVSVAF